MAVSSGLRAAEHGALLCRVYLTGGPFVNRSNDISLPVQPRGITVQEETDAFLERDLSANTRRNFQSDLRRFCRMIGPGAAETVTTTEIRDHLAALQGRGRKAASPETYNRHRTTLHALYEWLIREGEVDANPVARVERKKAGNRLPRPMTRGQVEELFERLRGLRERALFSLLYLSGT